MWAEKMVLAHQRKDDEFYTRYEDIEKELIKYKDKFKGKVIYMPCDDPAVSNFWKFFIDVFDDWKIKLIKASFIDGYLYEYNGREFSFRANFGDFRKNTEEPADIICTNPPFSLLRDFLLCFGNRDFCFIGNQMLLSYKIANPFLQNHHLYVGGDCKKFIYKESIKPVSGGVWFCSWITEARIKLTKKLKDIDIRYSDDGLLCIDKVIDVPIDYDKPMLVPVTFCKFLGNWHKEWKIIENSRDPYINGKKIFKRFLIQKIG